MERRRTFFAVLGLSLSIAAFAGGPPAAAVPPDPAPDEANGKKWRQLYETTGVSWSQVAQICPRDGVTPCAGSIGTKDFNGWVWGTAAQVKAFFGTYAPEISTADPATVSGGQYYLPAGMFLGPMRWTDQLASTYFAFQRGDGWTSSDADGVPVQGSVGNGHPPPSGHFSVVPVGTADEVSATRGVWLWKPIAGDHTPPQIAASHAGTLGNNGWYVSDVSVTWNVADAESEVTSREGCDPTTVAFDTTGTTLTCRGTSGGGTASASTVVRRDTTPPTVTCVSPAPVFEIFQLGAWVQATVTDQTSFPQSGGAVGPANTSVPGSYTTSVTGSDRAGNRTTVVCSYTVAAPTCRGLAPTRLGTTGNDVISGTNGRDVIMGLAGADTIKGLGGDDVICGGDGPDTIDGGAGNDVIDGGASPDDLNGGTGDDFLDGGLHNDSLRGDSGTDTCISGELRMSSCER
jgi:hypothetical protein